MVDEASSAADTHLSPAPVAAEADVVLGSSPHPIEEPDPTGSEAPLSRDDSYWIDSYNEEPRSASRGAGTCEALCLVVARLAGARRRYRLAHRKSDMARVEMPVPGDAMQGVQRRHSTGSVGAMVLLAKRMITRLRGLRRQRTASSTEEGDGGIELAPQAVPPILIRAPESDELRRIESLGPRITVEASFPADPGDRHSADPITSAPELMFGATANNSDTEDSRGARERAQTHDTVATSPAAHAVKLMLPEGTTGSHLNSRSSSPPKAMVGNRLSERSSQPMLQAYSAAAVSEEWLDDGMGDASSMREASSSRRSQPPKSPVTTREAPKPKPAPKPNVFDDDLETDLMLLG